MTRFAMKRAMMTAALVVPLALISAQPAGASWLPQDTAIPQGASVWSFSAVACTSPGSCMAVGNADSSLLAEVRSGSTWTVVTIPDPGGGQLNGISCTSASSCEAVGQATPSSTTETLAEVWNGSSWSIQTTPNPGGASSSQLSGVSCTSASSCEAVGQSTTGSTTTTLAEVWNGSSWSIRTSPNVSGAANSQLAGVSCTSAGSCEAAGSSDTGTNFATLAEVWNGAAWKIQTTPNPSGTFAEFNSVSCTAASACTAVGTDLAERWNGTSWALQKIASPHGSAPANLASVSCTDSIRCMAVGSFFKAGVQMMVADRWDGTKWAVEQTPLDTSFDSDGLSGVSCVHATACTAVGFYHDPVDGDRALAEVWALRWQLQLPTVPTGALASGLQTVSCPFATSCTAVGDDELSGSVFDAFAEGWNGSTWAVETIPDASNSSLSGVSCNGAKICTAVGDDVGSGGTLLSLALRWNGANWTVQSTPNPAGAVHSFLVSVSCPTTTACTAVGFYTKSSGHQFPFAERWNGTSWALKTTPAPTGSTTGQLNGVSCTSTTACEAVGSDDTSTWAEAWNGTSWKIQTTPTPTGGRNAFLGGVSCLKAKQCMAVGDFFNGAKVIPLAEGWNGTNWTVQNTKTPNGTVSEFSSVSCSTTPGHVGCQATGSVLRTGVDLPLDESWDGTHWAVNATQAPANVTRSNLSSVSCSSIINCMSVGFYDASGGIEAPLGEQWS
jgi:hypothetical protein